MNSTQKKVLIWLVVAVAVVVLLISVFDKKSGVPVDQSTGLSQTNIGEFPEGVKNGDLFERWFTKTLPPGTNSVALFTNRTGRDVVAVLGSADILTGQTASSTSNVSLFATTSTSIATVQDFTALTGTPLKNFLINSVTIATSSTATTTSSIYAVAVAKGNGMVVVPDGSTVWGYLQQNTTLAATSCVSLGLCESATSTNRGFNPVFNVKIYSPKF